ncbi:DUF2252 domain-containing protein [Weissella viridescens]|jgi:uncharacterized protein (DUF2252 family)|uniref:DUF2252 domain-containing protein n=1 Tax=Weissella viridescens TaxID=1629 RepID=UPI001C7DDEE4|nr:DUF2252 domain-containing protein [Weissella viridescens]MBX4173194.1 DUF2252 domain-containing protein [Weissella viridescens]
MARKPNSPYNFKNTDVAVDNDSLIQIGKNMGTNVSKTDISGFTAEKRDVKQIMDVRNSLLIKDLLQTKRERMSKSDFAFFRGTVDIMNYDLDKHPNSNIHVLIGGDAHLGNFGFYGSPEGQLLFDMNDFDESRIGFWEYDLKRFLVSCLLVAKQQDLEMKKVNKFLIKVVDTYRDTLIHMSELPALQKFYLPSTLDNLTQIFGKLEESSESFEASFDKLVQKSVKKALRSDSNYAVKKYTEIRDDGTRRFIENAPVTIHINSADYQKITDSYLNYRSNSRSDVRLFLEDFHIIDIVRHSVGVGSVGTLCYLMLLEDADNNHLVLQIKQALPIYQDSNIYRSHHHTQGENIVDSQLILQSASDTFLGYFDTDEHSFYVRQFKDMKGSINLEKLDWSAYQDYILICVILLARAHSQSPTFPMIIGYLQSHDWMSKSFVDFANNYLQQVEYDYETFTEE